MTIEELREACSAAPFRPFRLHWDEERSVEVLGPNHVLVSPTGRTLIVFRPDDSFEVVDVASVEDLEFVGP